MFSRVFVACVMLGCGTSAFGQNAKPPMAEMSAPLYGTASLVVTQVDPDGTIRLTFAPSVGKAGRSMLGANFVEGYYLLLANSPSRPGKPMLFRVQVTDIGEEWVLTAKTGADAARMLRVDDKCGLVRPANATTARLRGLPDSIELTVPSDDSPAMSEIVAKSESVMNLKRIGLAIHNYHDTYGYFPPAYVEGPDGKPWHSWRVLILPFLEQNDIFNAYDFREPWDSPKNKALIARMPKEFRDPINAAAKPGVTHYAALTGQKTAMKPPVDKQVGARLRDITDGTSMTVLITSIDPKTEIPWTKPEDINVAFGFKGFAVPGGIATPYTFGGKGGGKSAPFLFADGSVKMLPASIGTRLMEAMMTSRGAEIVNFDMIPTESLSINAAKVKFLRIREDGSKPTAVIE